MPHQGRYTSFLPAAADARDQLSQLESDGGIMGDSYTISIEDTRFVYREGELCITLYEDGAPSGLSVLGARDSFENEKWNATFGEDVARALYRLFNHPEVVARFNRGPEGTGVRERE